MHYEDAWVEMNVKELRKRSIQLSGYYYDGHLILIRGNSPDYHIDLIKSNGISVITVNECLIDYREISKEGNIKRRMEIFMDAVRNFDFYFLVDKKLSDLIEYGYEEDND